MCESAHFDISNCSYLPTYIAKNHHIIIPIFMAAGITNLTFLTNSYRTWDYRDELVWAAAWLYRATNDTTYLNTAESLYNEFGLGSANGWLDWDEKVSGVQVRYVKEFKFTVPLTKQVMLQMLINTVRHRHSVPVSVSCWVRVLQPWKCK